MGMEAQEEGRELQPRVRAREERVVLRWVVWLERNSRLRGIVVHLFSLFSFFL